MKIRTKAAGLVVGMSLTLSSIFGVTAQTVVDTNITLLDNDPGNGGTGICAASIAGTTAHDFGDFRWDGTAYTGLTAGAFQVLTTQTISPVDTECNYTFSGSNLVLGDESVLASGIALTAGVDDAPTTLDETSTFDETVAAITGTNHPIGYDLSGALDLQTPGEYTGTLTITAVSNVTP